MPLAVLHSPEQWTARFGAGSSTMLSLANCLLIQKSDA